MQDTNELPAGIVIRNAKFDDLIHVMHINRLCLPENYTFSFFESLYRDFPMTFLVAEANGRIVGYIMCRIERILSKFERLKLKKAGHVVSIAVVPEYRGLGIGKALMLSAMRAMKDYYGCDETYLEVRVSNDIAIRLYEKLGYVKVERIKGYYADGEDAYVMARRL